MRSSRLAERVSRPPAEEVAVRMILLGLEATLFREDCRKVVFTGPSSPRNGTFLHEGADRWLPSGSDHPQGDEEILDLVGEHLKQPGDALTCTLPNEHVEYRVEKKGVQIHRTPLVSADHSEQELAQVTERLFKAFGGAGANRKEKLRQAVHFGNVVLNALAGHEGRALRVLDASCGRSYLGSMLTLLLRSKGWDVQLHGIDYSTSLVEKARGIAASLGIDGATFEVADLGTFSARPTPSDMLVSLHGCDTLSDDAIRLAVESGARYAFIAPCCQQEMRHALKNHPLSWISRYGLLEQRLADVLTDGLRSLVLEALGYKVNVIRFADQEVTPKNLLIQAVRRPMPESWTRERAREARAFASEFGVWVASLDLLERTGPVK